jgi:hypothetical protein
MLKRLLGAQVDIYHIRLLLDTNLYRLREYTQTQPQNIARVRVQPLPTNRVWAHAPPFA